MAFAKGVNFAYRSHGDNTSAFYLCPPRKDTANLPPFYGKSKQIPLKNVNGTIKNNPSVEGSGSGSGRLFLLLGGDIAGQFVSTQRHARDLYNRGITFLRLVLQSVQTHGGLL